MDETFVNFRDVSMMRLILEDYNDDVVNAGGWPDSAIILNRVVQYHLL